LEIRVRFAPSPTGHLHIGSLRTAIFNWLFARHNNGKFLLRIEDTDLERSKQEYTDSILETFKWMRMDPDEPILVQSKRFKEHKKLAEELLKKGFAYKCYCVKRDEQEIEGSYSKYSGKCKNLTSQDNSVSFVIRFKIPNDKTEISFNDLIHGKITFPLDQFDDFVILRSDGTPTYNFVVVADDIFMRISHIIRGEDHISNTPKQILLYNAIGVKSPEFAHVPSILNESGQKLSKRDAAVSVIEYKKEGFLVDALFNYLVRLGWAHKDQEIFSREELITLFSLEHVGKSGSIFDIKKLEWLNGIYIRQKDSKELLKIIESDVNSDFRNKTSFFNNEQILKLIDLYKERSKTLLVLSEIIILLIKLPANYEKSAINEFVTEKTIYYLKELINELKSINDWTEATLSEKIKSLCKKLEIKLPNLAQPIRIALTGNITSPGVFELLAVLSKDESINRLNAFLEFLKK